MQYAVRGAPVEQPKQFEQLERRETMIKSAIALAFAVCLINSPALSRAPVRSGTTTCKGRVEVNQDANPGWHQIDICSFNGNTVAGKAILEACGVGNACQIKAYGEWAPDFYVKRIISVRRIDNADLNEIPEEYRGLWMLAGEPSKPNGKEARMPVGSKGIGWLKDVCLVTAVKRKAVFTIVLREVCGDRRVTELWTLRNLNGAEMLIVATIAATTSPFTPDISIYVRDTQPASK
jgi:hypothetical protein